MVRAVILEGCIPIAFHQGRDGRDSELKTLSMRHVCRVDTDDNITTIHIFPKRRKQCGVVYTSGETLRDEEPA